MKKSTYHYFFSNLANPLRVDIISCLKDADMCVNELAYKTGEEQSKLSHALSGLKQCNLVSVKQKGKKRIYSLNRKTLMPILKIIDNHAKNYCKNKCKECSCK